MLIEIIVGLVIFIIGSGVGFKEGKRSAMKMMDKRMGKARINELKSRTTGKSIKKKGN